MNLGQLNQMMVNISPRLLTTLASSARIRGIRPAGRPIRGSISPRKARVIPAASPVVVARIERNTPRQRPGLNAHQVGARSNAPGGLDHALGMPLTTAQATIAAK
jgi:hypothetical protein